MVLKFQGFSVSLSREGINQIHAEREEMYRCRLPDVWQVLLLLRPGEVDNDVPDEMEIAEAARGL